MKRNPNVSHLVHKTISFNEYLTLIYINAFFEKDEDIKLELNGFVAKITDIEPPGLR
jgi:hypothetical protein